MSHGVQVHWLRVILDEGHMLGASLAITNKLQMACALRADRSSSSSLLSLPPMSSARWAAVNITCLYKKQCVTQG